MQPKEWNRLVPELTVASYNLAKDFYTGILGFALCFERPEDRFGYFDLHGAQVMLLEDEADALNRRGEPGPCGKGLHLQIEVDDLQAMLSRLENAGVALARGVEEAWYRVDNQLHGHREIFIHDLDGYLLRFTEHFDVRPA